MPSVIFITWPLACIPTKMRGKGKESKYRVKDKVGCERGRGNGQRQRGPG